MILRKAMFRSGGAWSFAAIEAKWTWNLLDWRCWYWPGGFGCMEPEEWTVQIGGLAIEARWPA